MDNTWLLDMEAKIFSIVKAKTEKKVKIAFPTVFYTTSNESNDVPVFPTIYIHQLQGSSYSDLEGSTVTGLMCDMECVITVNTKKTDCKDISKLILQAFTELRFHVSTPPVLFTEENMYTCTMRFRRMIGQGDTI